MERERVLHEFAPVFDRHSRVLILGTIPSPKSRENGFYYGHPQNRFWRVLSALLGETLPETREARIALLLRHHIALWDVLRSCEICGASDSSIRNAVPNPLSALLCKTEIRVVFASGQKAAALYRRFQQAETGMEIHALPSTSPANCRISYPELLRAYSVLLPYLE